MNRLRWRLARLVAPQPIIVGPPSEEDGGYLLMRSRHDGQKIDVWVQLASFEITSEVSINPRRFGDTHLTGKAGRAEKSNFDAALDRLVP